jgi:hypothetical protein
LHLSDLSSTRSQHTASHCHGTIFGVDGRIEITVAEGHKSPFRIVCEAGPIITIQGFLDDLKQCPFLGVLRLYELTAE